MFLKTENPPESFPDGFYAETPSLTILESPLMDLADILQPLTVLIEKSEPLEECDNLQVVCGLSTPNRQLL